MFSESRKIIAIGGVPATGKSTILKKFLAQFPNEWALSEAPLVPFMARERLIVLGHYAPNEKFPGTDRMSMAVQPKAMEFINDGNAKFCDILFEGDRLFTASFLEHCAEHSELQILIITSNPTIIEARHIGRADTQSEQFKTGRETKIDNIRSNFMLMDYIKTFEHNTPQDTDTIVQYLNNQLLEGYNNADPNQGRRPTEE